MATVVGIRFKKASRVYDFDGEGLDLSRGDAVIVEVEKGLGMGTVIEPPREVDPSTLGRALKKVVRKADMVDMERHIFNTERENEAFRICREKIIQYKLPMKLIRVEYLFDSSKAVFYFTSDLRVDFRELVKDLAAGFHTRIEMRQIGVRDEAKMIGGLGPCGRELCCAGFLSDFEPVTIKMAKDQNLALNPVKISGICGRLMCCLSYEHEMYKGEKKARKEKELLERSLAGAELPEGVQGPVMAQSERPARGCNCSGGCHERGHGHGGPDQAGQRQGQRHGQNDGRRQAGPDRQGQRPGQRQSGRQQGQPHQPHPNDRQNPSQSAQTGAPGGQGRENRRGRERSRDRRPQSQQSTQSAQPDDRRGERQARPQADPSSPAERKSPGDTPEAGS